MAHSCSLHSVDGLKLRLGELRGSKARKDINLNNKELGVASGFIVAACIKGNQKLKTLKCALAFTQEVTQSPVRTRLTVAVFCTA